MCFYRYPLRDGTIYKDINAMRLYKLHNKGEYEMIIISIIMLILGFFGLVTGIILICIKNTRKAGIITTISSVAAGTIFIIVLVISMVIYDNEQKNIESSNTSTSSETYSEDSYVDDYDSSVPDEDYDSYESDSSDETITPDEKEKEANKESIPEEYSSALSKAESYSNTFYLSKVGIYDQLISEYGDQFSAEAAQYAVDNLVADYKFNALQNAKNYQETMNMSPEAIREQLTSEAGEKFTKEEADFAVKNLK